jgi:hypothetical protein
MTDQTDRDIPDNAESANNSRIVAELAIAMNLNEFRAQMLHVIQKVGTLGVPCELYLLVRRKVVHVGFY